MRALPLFLVLLVVAVAIWIVQSGAERSADAPIRPAAPSVDEPRDEPEQADIAGERTQDAGETATAIPADANEPAERALVVALRVADASGAPLSDVRATLTLRGRGADLLHAVLGTTGRDGRVETALDIVDGLSSAALHGLDWRLDACAPGYGAAAVEGALAGARRIDARLTLEVGATLRGRVVDARGLPVAGAEVSAQAMTSAGGLQQPAAEGVLSDAEGRFALACRPGRRGAIAAYARAHGAGLVHPLDLGRDADVGDVALAPLGTLSGCVTYPDGTPARHAVLSAAYLAADPAEPREVQGEQRREHRRRVLESVEPGRLGDWTKTDDEGRFRFAGLVPGPYQVQVQVASFLSHVAYDPALVFVTPRDDVELSVDVTRLVVELRGDDGAPAPGLDVTCRLLDEDGVPADESALFASWTEPTSGDPARAGFVVLPGRRYVLAAHAGGAALEQEVRVQEGVYEELHVLTLPDASATGELTVDLRDADGRAWSDWRVTLRAPRLAHAVGSWELRAPDADGVLRGVPVGEWLVEVTPAGTAAADNFLWLPSPRTPVSIRSGERTSVALTGARGARVRVELDASELGAWRPLSDDPAVNARRLEREGVWVWLQPADGGDWLPVLSVDERIAPEPRRRTLPGLAAGGVAAVPPGAYTLMVSGPGVQQTQEPIELAAGELTTRRVVLRPR